MRKKSIIFICLVVIFLFVACANNIEFTETNDKAILSKDGTEYTFVGNEGKVWCFGELELIGRVKAEPKNIFHIAGTMEAGMYSVNGSQDVLVRYFPYNEFAAIYVKSELLKTEISLDNCIRFEFVKYSLYDKLATIPNNGITECEQFLNEIKNGEKAEDAGLYDFVKQPDGMLKNCYVYGYICGIVQENVNIVIPLQVMSFDDKAYSIRIDDTEYVLPQEWADKLINQ